MLPQGQPMQKDADVISTDEGSQSVLQEETTEAFSL